MASATLTTFLAPQINFPSDFNTNFLMLLRWIHFLAGITWIGLLYFFNLVNVPLMKELDATTKGKVMPALMMRALWWFRMSAALTVLAGLMYWGNIVAADAHNGGGSSGTAMGSFFLIWTIVWGLLYACLIPGKGIFDQGAFVGVVYAVVVAVAAWLFLSLNSHGWESNRPAFQRSRIIGIGHRHELRCIFVLVRLTRSRFGLRCRCRRLRSRSCR